MFTMQQILKLYEKGVDIVFKEEPDIPKQKGEWDLSALEVIVFLSTTKRKRARGITILHELWHAAEELRGFKKLIDTEIDRLAEKTYDSNQYVFAFVKQVYRLKYI